MCRWTKLLQAGGHHHMLPAAVFASETPLTQPLVLYFIRVPDRGLLLTCRDSVACFFDNRKISCGEEA